MEIISRLKEFINYMQVPVTQFADACLIPRPTLSQLLNGRNKKVSDEVISKIHAGYPNLSITWLLFNEGSMLTNENIQFSGAQNSSKKSVDPSQSLKIQTNNTDLDLVDGFTVGSPEKNTSTLASKNSGGTELRIDLTDRGSDYDNEEGHDITLSIDEKVDSSQTDMSVDEQANDEERSIQSIAFDSDKRRKIVNIIVYYSDNSFESFVPGFRKG